MNQITEEWVRKAEEDRNSAVKEWDSSEPSYNNICFHCQQCVEKYFKALLQEQGKIPPRIHDLVKLMDQLSEKEKGKFNAYREGLGGITTASSAYRYPGGVDATQALTWEQIDLMNKVRDIARESLGLK